MTADAIYAEMLAQLQRLNSSIEEATRIAADATTKIVDLQARIAELEVENAQLRADRDHTHGLLIARGGRVLGVA